MAYSVKSKKTGTTYYLHSKDVTLKGGQQQTTIYFFCRDERENAIDDLPAGYVTMENERTGLPMLKKA